MKKVSIINGVVFVILLFAGESFAQCQANLINYTDVAHIFKETMCSEAMGRCYVELAKLQTSDRKKYSYAYCDVGATKKVTKRSDRCQSKEMVRCTIEWSDGTIDSYDEFCQGCTGEGAPAAVPCGWVCPFPEK
ncbi:MAG: hypothetical protein D3914_08865 [Candidatus Electrothrix sp. LOE2]|nr:hypothetical protein [Candidatus Electrothrix sp. LOE2]